MKAVRSDLVLGCAARARHRRAGGRRCAASTPARSWSPATCSRSTPTRRATSPPSGCVLGVVSSVFIAVAVYVSTVVIVNGVDTVIAGRLRQIALLRLLGADAGSLRRAVVRGTTVIATGGAVVGVLVGAVVGDLTRVMLVAGGPPSPTATIRGSRCSRLPAAVVVSVAAAAASWVGSRAVLRATPVQALHGRGGSGARDGPDGTAAPHRHRRTDRGGLRPPRRRCCTRRGRHRGRLPAGRVRSDGVGHRHPGRRPARGAGAGRRWPAGCWAPTRRARWPHATPCASPGARPARPWDWSSASPS